MTVTKHYENDHISLYITEGNTTTCVTLDSDSQIRRLGECLINLYRTDGRTVTITPKQNGKEKG